MLSGGQEKFPRSWSWDPTLLISASDVRLCFGNPPRNMRKVRHAPVEVSLPLMAFRRYVFDHLLVHETCKCRRIPCIQVDLSVATFFLFVHSPNHKEMFYTRK